MIIIYLSIFIFGLALLIWGANRFIDYSVILAKRLKISPLFIGIFIIGLGTSAPELLVSALAAWQQSDVALGNAIGSNITNISCILGITALIAPITFRSSILKGELPFLTIISLITCFLLYDQKLSSIDGLILILLFIAFFIFSIFKSRKKINDPLEKDTQKELFNKDSSLSLYLIVLWIFIGLIVMIASSQMLIWSCRKIALMLGISELIIGLTIVALGTSLPELASSIAAVRKNEHEIAVGNIIGSNIFNTLMVIGLSGTIQEIKVDPIFIVRDCSIMLALTFSLFLFGYRFKQKEGSINRFEGGLLFLIYILYNSLIGYTIVKGKNQEQPPLINPIHKVEQIQQSSK